MGLMDVTQAQALGFPSMCCKIMPMSTSTSLSAKPITRSDYAPYGALIAVDPSLPFGPANFGRAKRFNWLGEVQNLRPNAKLNLCIFSYEKVESSPIELKLLEKHPQSTQVFLPMSADSAYLTVVALGADVPDLTTLKAFIVNGPQGITYHPGIWHYPMTVVGSPMDLACVVFEDETRDDCLVWNCDRSITVNF